MVAAFFSRALYTRRKFRPIYAKVMNKQPFIHRNSAAYIRYYGNAMTLLTEALPNCAEWAQFEFPFNELFVSFLCVFPSFVGISNNFLTF